MNDEQAALVKERTLGMIYDDLKKAQAGVTAAEVDFSEAKRHLGEARGRRDALQGEYRVKEKSERDLLGPSRRAPRVKAPAAAEEA
jgi:hypothetical protein